MLNIQMHMADYLLCSCRSETWQPPKFCVNNNTTRYTPWRNKNYLKSFHFFIHIREVESVALVSLFLAGKYTTVDDRDAWNWASSLPLMRTFWETLKPPRHLSHRMLGLSWVVQWETGFMLIIILMKKERLVWQWMREKVWMDAYEYYLSWNVLKMSHCYLKGLL
jgi:hypothetical protein